MCYDYLFAYQDGGKRIILVQHYIAEVVNVFLADFRHVEQVMLYAAGEGSVRRQAPEVRSHVTVDPFHAGVLEDGLGVVLLFGRGDAVAYVGEISYLVGLGDISFADAQEAQKEDVQRAGAVTAQESGTFPVKAFSPTHKSTRSGLLPRDSGSGPPISLLAEIKARRSGSPSNRSGKLVMEVRARDKECRFVSFEKLGGNVPLTPDSF